MSETIIKAPASTKLLSAIPHGVVVGVRVFGESPERSAIQIRTFGKTAEHGQAQRAAYSHASLTINQIEALIVALEAERTRLVSHL